MKLHEIIPALALTFLLLTSFVAPVFSQRATMGTSTNQNIVASNTLIQLSAASSHITVSLSSGSSAVYLNFSGAAATSSNYILNSGGTYTYVGPPTDKFRYLGAGTTGTISIITP